jgi:hypothetical protein
MATRHPLVQQTDMDDLWVQKGNDSLRNTPQLFASKERQARCEQDEDANRKICRTMSHSDKYNFAKEWEFNFMPFNYRTYTAHYPGNQRMDTAIGSSVFPGVRARTTPLGAVQKARRRSAPFGDLFCRRTQLVRPPQLPLLAVKISLFPVQASDALPRPRRAPQYRRLRVDPQGSGQAAAGFLSVFLGVADAESLPPGWILTADFSLTVVNQKMWNCKWGLWPITFEAGRPDRGYAKFLRLHFLDDINFFGFTMSRGYVVNDTLIIRCDMTNVSSNVSTAAAAATAAPTSHVAVPAGMYPTGAGGLLYIPAGALASNKEFVDAT